jgi:NAD(P)-dependent dehydrogenase (short-subunit alcohol dehydrogenase family)
MRLKDKVAIITGRAPGMGEAEARLFAAESARVIVADIPEHEAGIIPADVRARGEDATAAKIDVTSESESVDLIARAVATYGRLDILVNNAGILGSSVGNPDGLEGWHRIIAVNQTSVFLGTTLAAEQMAKTGVRRSSTSVPSWGLSAARAATRRITPPRVQCGSTPRLRLCGMAGPGYGSTPSI